MQTTVETPIAITELASKLLNNITYRFGSLAWKLEGKYNTYKSYVDKKILSTEPVELIFESMIKELAKHTSKLYNLALSTLPLEAFKHVPKHAAGTLLNAINYGVFKLDGQKKDFKDFYNYCWLIISSIGVYTTADQLLH